jgi:protein TonB
MFEHALLESSPRKTSPLHRIYFLLAYVAEAMVVGALILVPLLYTQALPRQLLMTDVVLPPPPPGRPPAPPAGRPMPVTHHSTGAPFTQPPIIPSHIAQVIEPPEPPQSLAGPQGPFVPGVPDGLGAGNSIPGGAPWARNTPPPPPEKHAAPKPQIIRLSSGVVAAKAVFQPKPSYPPLAVIAHIQGTVVLEAIIGKDGAIQDLKVLSGHPLLVRAALDAVKTWRYQPTLLNSEPVEVLTEINVNFQLGE